MKSLAHWGATIGLIGSTVLTTWLGNPMKAFALPEADVVKVLEPIPVFTIANDKGSPLVGVDNNKQQFTPIFISQDEAKKFFQQLSKDKPDVAKDFKVRVLSLANIYKFGVDNAKSPQKLNIGYVPNPTDIDSAKKILTAGGKQYEGGVPLFVARGGKDQGYLTISFNNEQRIPFFFEESQITDLVTQLKKDKPDLASTLKIDVIPLESVLKAFESENDTFLKQIVIWPTKEMWKIIEASNPQTKPGAPAAKPGAPSAKPVPPAQSQPAAPAPAQPATPPK
jgi:hypothetical protein